MADDDPKSPTTQIVDISESLDEDAVSAMLDRTVAGKYRILRRLARGGMGVVYVAEHITLERKVVIKVLSYHLADDSRAKSRFEREARGLSVLDHPNVVTVHDFGVEQGLTYIVMEYVDGENLSQRVRRKGRIPYDQLLPVVIQTIDALAAAHEKGIVHRDVKPSNVMVTTKAGRSDYVKVLDFGLAKLASSSVDITKGNLVGTVSYLSPEVIKGADALPCADVYALGVMFYYLLAGSKPFQASDDMSVLYQHVNVEADWLGDLLPPGEAPQEFLEFIHQCMAKDPAKRPTDAGEMRRMLAELVSLPSISAFSLDSSMALPRYQPPDSSGQSLRRPRHITSQLTDSQTTAERPSMEMSQGSMSRPSIARARPKRGLRVAVIAFTSFSVGLVAIVLLVNSNRAEPEAEPSVEPRVAVAAPVNDEPPALVAAVLTLQTTPSAEVAIDGTLRGRSPLDIELTPGQHIVSVSEVGHKPWTRAVQIAEGQQRTLDVFLEKSGPGEPARVEQAERPPVPPAVRKPKQAVAEPVPEAVASKSEPDAGAAPVEVPTPQPAETNKSLLSVEGRKKGLLPVGN